MLEPTECTTTEGIRALVRACDDLLRVWGWGRGRGRWWHSRVHGVVRGRMLALAAEETIREGVSSQKTRAGCAWERLAADRELVEAQLSRRTG